MSINRTARHLFRGAGHVLELCPDSRDRLSTIRPYPNDQADVINREPRTHHS
ncbi:MAG: hypothetical protein WAW42_07660 [Candidatus Competibacteraceae bacterium]|jgi:hypothetical protein